MPRRYVESVVVAIVVAVVVGMGVAVAVAWVANRLLTSADDAHGTIAAIAKGLAGVGVVEDQTDGTDTGLEAVLHAHSDPTDLRYPNPSPFDNINRAAMLNEGDAPWLTWDEPAL